MLLLCLVPVAPARPAVEDATLVLVETPLGAFEIELFPNDAPITVANFLNYVESGRFDGSFLHRRVAGFIIQGGGFTFSNGDAVAIPTYAPIINEFKRSNVRGTIAMAKAAGNPNSATSQWFINLKDNSADLDVQNGGFTVFGNVVGDGMAVVDALAAVPIYNLGGSFTEVPLRDYTSGSVTAAHVLFTTITAGSAVVATPPLLLRHVSKGNWYTYRLGPEGNAVGIEEEGKVTLPSSRDLTTVSRGDFDGEREPDVLLREADGGWLLATLRGTKVTKQAPVNLPAAVTFEVVATADFNGDRRDDVLLRDSSTGRWQVWLLNGTSLLAGGETGMPPNAFVGTGDFDGDGDDDVLLRSGGGTWTTYFVDGPGVSPTATPNLPRNASTTVQAVGDLDGDGIADVLTRAASGKWQAWLIAAGTVRSKGTVSMTRDRDFTLVANADFNGDGTADALLRGTDGTWRLYTLRGRTVIKSGEPQMTADTSYSLVVADDFDRDGMADVLLRDLGGNWLLYTIDGRVPEVASSSVPDMSTQSAWVPQLD